MLLQLGCDVALRPDERLLALVVGGHRLAVRVADLDVVPEHLVVADLQGRDAGTLALAGLDRRQVRPAVPPDRAQLVELAVAAVPYQPPLAHGGGRVVGQRLEKARVQLRQDVDAGHDPLKRRGGERHRVGGDLRQDAERIAQRHQIPGRRGAERAARQQPLEVVHARQVPADRRPLGGPLEEELDAVQALPDRLQRQERALDPVPQQPAAGRRLGPIEDLEERAVAPAVPDALDQLEGAPGRGVQDHRVARLVPDDPGDVLQVGLVSLLEVVQEGAGRAHGEVAPFDAEAGQRCRPQPLGQGARGGVGRQGPGRHRMGQDALERLRR